MEPAGPDGRVWLDFTVLATFRLREKLDADESTTDRRSVPRPGELFTDRRRPSHTNHPVSCQPTESRRTTVSHTPLEEPAETETIAVPEDDIREKLQSTAWARFRPLLMRLHFYADIFVAPFILTAAVTGVLYALIPQVDNVVNRHELTVEQVGEDALPLADQLAAVRKAHPEGTVASIRPLPRRMRPPSSR